MFFTEQQAPKKINPKTRLALELIQMGFTLDEAVTLVELGDKVNEIVAKWEERNRNEREQYRIGCDCPNCAAARRKGF